MKVLFPELFALLILFSIVLLYGTSFCSELHTTPDDQVLSIQPRFPSGLTEEGNQKLYPAQQKDKIVEQSNILHEDVPGPGAFLGSILRDLSLASSESDSRNKSLVASIPNVLPDLQKVLVSL